MTVRLSLAGTVLLLAACGSPSTPQTTSTQKPEPQPESRSPLDDSYTVIVGAQVFDGEKKLGKLNVVFKDRLIVELGKAPEEFGDAEIIHAEGMTLLPGLIDAHTHTYEEQHLIDAVRFGVTTELDMLAGPKPVNALKKKASSGQGPVMAELLSAGNPVLAKGGFGTDFGLDLDTVDADTDISQFIDARLKEEPNYIKILWDDMTVWGAPARPTLDAATVALAISETHDHGLLAVVHTPRPADALHAIKSGADGLIALYLGGENPSLIEELKVKGAFVTPTASLMMVQCGEALGPDLATDERLSSRLTESMLADLKGQRLSPGLDCEQFRSALSELIANEVPILLGTDAPQPGVIHGASMHAELEFFVQAGGTPAQALRASTRATADAYRLSDRGRIEVGARADLLLVLGDPTEDILQTRAIQRVFVAGRAAEL